MLQDFFSSCKSPLQASKSASDGNILFLTLPPQVFTFEVNHCWVPEYNHKSLTSIYKK